MATVDYNYHNNFFNPGLKNCRHERVLKLQANNNNIVQYRLRLMLMRNQHLYKSPAIEVYGHYRLLLPWLRVPCWFFCNTGLKNCWHGRRGIEPTTTTLDLSSQSGAYMTSQPWRPHLSSIPTGKLAHHFPKNYTIVIFWKYSVSIVRYFFVFLKITTGNRTFFLNFAIKSCISLISNFYSNIAQNTVFFW